MSANFENPAVATGLPNSKEGQCKEVQTTTELCSLPMLVRLCSKTFNLGFSSTGIENFQMYELGLEKAEEPDIKLPTFV